jgi:hypothetical protein
MVLSAAAFTALAGSAAGSTTGLAAPFASSSGACSVRNYPYDSTVEAKFPPLAASRDNVLARVTSTAPVRGLIVERGSSDGYIDAITGGADTTWVAIGALSGGVPTTISGTCTSTNTSMSVDLFDAPTAPATFSGALTLDHRQYNDDDYDTTSHVLVRGERGGHYVADLTLTQGSLELSGEGDKVFSSSGRFDLGMRKAGTVDLSLTALDGPQARWAVTISRLPAEVADFAATPTASRQGMPITISYAVSGDTRVSAAVVGSTGTPIRWIGTDFEVLSGSHSLRWDGLDDSGRPVPDGTYTIKISTDEGTEGEAPVTLDSTPPALQAQTPVRFTGTRAFVVHVSDRTTAVESALMMVDGKVVTRLGAGTSSLLYRPTRGWRVGSHQVSVTAVDALGNSTQRTFRVLVTGPKTYKASCLDKGLSIRPKSCLMAPSPNAAFAEMANLASIRWSAWGARAVGRGYELGMHLPYAHIPVTVVLTRPVYVEELGIYVYKHFRATSKYGTTSGMIQAN